MICYYNVPKYESLIIHGSKYNTEVRDYVNSMGDGAHYLKFVSMVRYC
jgi:hypothetical protein